MKITRSRYNELINKRNFVAELSKAVSGYCLNIERLSYDVLYKRGFEFEYLVVEYKGGAIAARNCNHNSVSAIFYEVYKLLNGGYYDEVADYNDVKDGAITVDEIEVEEEFNFAV